MYPSEKVPPFIEKWEGLKLHAYQDRGGVWTVGFGTTVYKDGTKVKQGDVITREQAYAFLMDYLFMETVAVNKMLADVKLNQNQFDSLIDFAYNEGSGALQGSHLLKLIRVNPEHPGITAEFMKWDKIHDEHGNLITSDWQQKRRAGEAELYFSK